MEVGLFEDAAACCRLTKYEDMNFAIETNYVPRYDQRIENPCVDGSIPPPGTTYKAGSVKHLRRFSTFTNTPEIPLKCPCCVPNCVREKLIVSNSIQLEPK